MTENTSIKSTPKKPAGPTWVRLVSDLGPALAFFIGYFWANKTHQPSPILAATMVFLPVAILGFAFSWWKTRKLSPIALFSFVMILIMSGLGIWLANDIFIKMRPTLIYSLMGLILIYSVLVKHNLLKSLFDGAIHMADEHWRKLSMNAGIMYVSLAIINEIMWRIFAPTTNAPQEHIWVTYNMWGDFAINMVFWIVSITMLTKHLTDEDGNSLLEQEEEQ